MGTHQKESGSSKKKKIVASEDSEDEDAKVGDAPAGDTGKLVEATKLASSRLLKRIARLAHSC